MDGVAITGCCFSVAGKSGRTISSGSARCVIVKLLTSTTISSGSSLNVA